MVAPSELSPTQIGSAWLQIEAMADTARQELMAVRGVRSEAASVRMQAQHLLEEAETLHDQAERVVAQAANTFAKAAALNPSAMRSMASAVRTLEEAIRAERHLKQGTRQQAEEDAHWAQKRATDAILNALSAVRRASNFVSRELEEARRTTATAESLKESAQSDLQRAQSMLEEAERRARQEARNLLNQPSISHALSSQEPGEWESQETRGVSPAEEAAPDSRPNMPSITDIERVTMPAKVEPPPAVSDVPPTGPPRPQEPFDPDVDLSGLEREPETLKDHPGLGSEGNLESAPFKFLEITDKPEEASTEGETRDSELTVTEGQYLDDPEPPGKITHGFPSRTPFDNEVIPILDVESLRQPPSPTEPSHVGAEDEFGDDLLAQLRESLSSSHPTEEATEAPPSGITEEPPGSVPAPADGGGPGYPGQMQSKSPPSTASPSQFLPLAETYSGILHLVLTPAADSATLSFFWDVLDAAAGVGKVIAQTPLPDGTGHEFTLDLGSDVMVMEEMKRQIPGAVIEALGQDRLHVRLGPRAG